MAQQTHISDSMTNFLADNLSQSVLEQCCSMADNPYKYERVNSWGQELKKDAGDVYAILATEVQ